MSGVQLIISDDHAGLKAARLAVFGGIPWQRCQFHLQQNASAYVPRQDMRSRSGRRISAPSSMPRTAPRPKPIWPKTVQKYAKTASKLADWMEKNIPEGLTVFAFPAAHQRKLRTTNLMERLNREIHRRTAWSAFSRVKPPACG